MLRECYEETALYTASSCSANLIAKIMECTRSVTIIEYFGSLEQ